MSATSSTTATQPELVVIDLNDQHLTEIVFCTGYEGRLCRGNEIFGSGFEWEALDTFDPFDGDHGLTPLTAGSRIISPEELDGDLCEAIGLDPDDGNPIRVVDPISEEADMRTAINTPSRTPWEPETWFDHQLLFPESIDISMMNQRELFWRYNSRRPDATEERYRAIRENPVVWRDHLAALRYRLANEVREICLRGGAQYEFTNGLCCVSDGNVMFPFMIAEWMSDKFYCGCFGQNSMHNIRVIASGNHRILVADFDAESG